MLSDIYGIGPQRETEGKCNAVLTVGDDYGDNHATFRCQLGPNHNGLHQEKWGEEGDEKTITWEKDQRETCPQCEQLFDSEPHWSSDLHDPVRFPCCFKVTCSNCSQKLIDDLKERTKDFGEERKDFRFDCPLCAKEIIYDVYFGELEDIEFWEEYRKQYHKQRDDQLNLFKKEFGYIK